MSKPESITINPFLKRRLSNDHRVRLMNLAARTFTAPELRDVEQAAMDALTRAFVEDALAVPEAELAALRRYGKTRCVTGIVLPDRLRLQTGTKAIPVNEEKTVERAEFEEFHALKPYTEQEIGFARWSGTSYESSAKTKIDQMVGRCYTSYVIALGCEVEIPGTGNTAAVFDLEEDAKNGWGVFVSDATKALIGALLLAQNARTKAEQALLLAAHKLVAAATVYGELVAIWPEVETIEGDLFGERPLTNTALVALSDDDRALLCNHMGRRGVTSAICAATSPAYGEAAA